MATDTTRKQRALYDFNREATFSEDVTRNTVCILSSGVASLPTAAWMLPAGVTERDFLEDEVGSLVRKLIMKCRAGEAITADQPLGIFSTSGNVGLCPHGKPMVGRSMDAQSVAGSYVSVWLDEELGKICDRSGETTAVAAATYTVLKTDYRLLVSYTATGTVTITLPTALLGVISRLEIVDTGDNANNNNITIATEGSEEIAGGATATMSTASGTLVLTNDGSDWFTL